ncbi:hypothetical protein ACEWY4_008580 [Coilia grayii]|uniref:Uncharacterized protein n=1 Tax=Coilia grayii TaxID=363190 RepID=A0ABD1KBB7_9TELE
MVYFWTTTVVYLLLCCICSGYATNSTCKWRLYDDLGLDVRSLDDGANYAAHLPDISDSNGCQMACCARDDCQLAILGTPADDGVAECFLVSCMKDGNDVCRLQPSSQFKVFRKMASPAQSAGTCTECCRSPRQVGPCKAAMPRFYYDISTQSCKSFIYGGCRGNSNNFESQEECESACRNVTGTDMETVDPAVLPKQTSDDFDEMCHAAPKTGPCRASLRHYFYNSSTGSCQTFIYGGCQGNKNNYATAEMCQATCNGKGTPSPRRPADVTPMVPAGKEHCLMASDPGRCRAAFSMFYYDSKTSSCHQFIYGGCGGNANRFSSLEECMDTCSVQDGQYNEHGATRDRWTPAFFLVATVGIISAVLLVGLILISVRKFKMTHVPLDDKEILLSEEELVEGHTSLGDTA